MSFNSKSELPLNGRGFRGYVGDAVYDLWTWTISSCLGQCFVFPLLLLILITGPLRYVIRMFLKRRTKNAYRQIWESRGDRVLVFGFFHPYCNAGGGGERVLWCAIKALQSRYEFVRIVVYTGDANATPSEIIKRAKERFGITLSSSIEFIYLSHRNMVEASTWPRFTLLGQSIGSILLGLEALFKFVPDVYIDTMGYAFTIPLFRYLGGCKTGCYVHYPTISTDMLSRVRSGETAFNNASFISSSPVLTSMKLLYYKLFAYFYGVVGRCSDLVMVNSSWTENHILCLWKARDKTVLLYPPVDTKSLLSIPLGSPEAEHHKNIISIAQFRPEKNHMLQVQAFGTFLKSVPKGQLSLFKLQLVGGCRNEGDAKRVNQLMQLVEDLGLKDSVEFHLNLSYKALVQKLSEATVGIHTMTQEHFGIGVVEFMAAGVIALAHNSGGPKMDIVIDLDGERTGFLADSEALYAKYLRQIFNMTTKERQVIRQAARSAVLERFSDETFRREFLKNTEFLVR